MISGKLTRYGGNPFKKVDSDRQISKEIDEIYRHIRKSQKKDEASTTNVFSTPQDSGGSGGGGGVPQVNTYNIHLSNIIQHYHTSGSSAFTAQKGGYWTYLTKEFVSTIDEIKTPIFFRDILGVKVSATTTLGGGNSDRYMFAGVMELVHHMPGIHPINWDNGTIRHAVTYQNYNAWGAMTPNWHFMYKMEYCNIMDGQAVPVFERLYKLPVDLPEMHRKAIGRLYDDSDPAQPLYNLITLLELIINVKI